MDNLKATLRGIVGSSARAERFINTVSERVDVFGTYADEHLLGDHASVRSGLLGVATAADSMAEALARLTPHAHRALWEAAPGIEFQLDREQLRSIAAGARAKADEVGNAKRGNVYGQPNRTIDAAARDNLILGVFAAYRRHINTKLGKPARPEGYADDWDQKFFDCVQAACVAASFDAPDKKYIQRVARSAE